MRRGPTWSALIPETSRRSINASTQPHLEFAAMIRRAHRVRRAAHRLSPSLEAFEPRLLMNGDVTGLGQFPLRTPATSNALLVRFADGADATAALNSVGGYVENQFPGGTSTVVLGQGMTQESAIATLGARSDVVYAEPNSQIEAQRDVFPNDPKFPDLWGLNNKNDVDIDAPQAWGITQGSPIIVAVIDSGIDLRSADLASKVWVNTAEVIGNRRDDDRDGYIDDVFGWNFVNNTGNVQDDNGHGSHVSGIIAAAGNNAYGVVGVNWNARIMPLKFLDATGSGSTDDAISAIYFAVAHGARVINASWGGLGYSRALHDAIAYASARNVVFVTSAGNESRNNDFSPSFPANDRLPNTLSVAAVDRNGRLADFSNWGPSTVDIAAPGVNITSTVLNGFASYSGTSMSSPYVAGVASLVLSVHPEFTSAQVVAAVRASAKPLVGLQGLIATGGIVSAARAITVGVQVALGNPVPAASVPVTYRADEIVERILYSDEFISRSGGNPTGYVTALYRNVLGRDPDPQGLEHAVAYVSNGAPLDGLVEGLMGSVEAARTKVARWYQTLLDRGDSLEALKASPDVVSWAALLLRFPQDEAVRASFLASDEYWRNQGSNTNGLINGFYQDVLERAPDSGGRVSWQSALASGSSRYDLIRNFQQADESKRVEVARWYKSVLGRSESISQLIEDPGVIEWASSLTS